MFKKISLILLFILIIIFVSNSLKNEYKLPNEYKNEIEEYINNETEKIIKSIDYEFTKAENIYQKCKESTDKTICINDLNNQILFIDNNESIFYVKLIEITDKYVPIKDNMPNTDYSATVFDYIYPYLKANNINVSKIETNSVYANQKINKIEKLIENINNN